jgi:hypothetical protein
VSPFDIVIRALDKVKRGEDLRSARCRDAIRFLDQRFMNPSPFVIGQRPEHSIEIKTKVNFYTGILSCCKFYVKDLENTGCSFSLVTDDEELINLAEENEISVLSSAEWACRF